MNAIVAGISGDADDMHFQEVPEPALKVGLVRVRVLFAGVNFMDISTRRGENGEGHPIIPGLEGDGVFEELSSSDSMFRTGDRVAWYFRWRSYADFVLIREVSLIRVPDDILNGIAAALPMQGLTAHHLAIRSYPVKEGDICLTHAASGGVGMLLTQNIVARGGQVIARV